MLIVLAMAMMTTDAYPQDYNCEGASWKAGEKFGHMLVDKFSEDKEACSIQGVPKSFSPGKQYLIQVVSKSPLGHKLAVEQGTLAGAKVNEGAERSSKLQNRKCGYLSKQKVSAYLWTAPTSKSESFHALCGSFASKVFVAPTVRISKSDAVATEASEQQVFATIA